MGAKVHQLVAHTPLPSIFKDASHPLQQALMGKGQLGEKWERGRRYLKDFRRPSTQSGMEGLGQPLAPS